MSKKENQWYILYFNELITIENWKKIMDELYSNKSSDTTANQENRHH